VKTNNRSKLVASVSLAIRHRWPRYLEAQPAGAKCGWRIKSYQQSAISAAASSRGKEKRSSSRLASHGWQRSLCGFSQPVAKQLKEKLWLAGCE